jgi:rhodanese-related sulfurtransferase
MAEVPEIDVCEHHEHAAGRVPGAAHIPLPTHADSGSE